MKVQEVIEMLTKYYKPTDELLICWWDKDGYPEHDLTDEQWVEVMQELDKTDDALQDITWLIDEAVSKIKGENK